jgi:hypothetical protein
MHMKKTVTFSAVMGAALATVAIASAQSQPATRTADQESVTLVGCIQREADFRSARDAGKGGVAGTGVGAGNEFILTNASMSKDSASGTAGATGTSGSASAAYELSGTGEGQASAFVGKRVEITGKLKPAETTASGRPTGGATAGQPPQGVDMTSKDLKLREIDVVSVKEASGTCPAK